MKGIHRLGVFAAKDRCFLLRGVVLCLKIAQRSGRLVKIGTETRRARGFLAKLVLRLAHRFFGRRGLGGHISE